MAKTEKLDLYKQHKDEYVAPKAPALIDVGPAGYLAIQGRGEPGSPEFQAKMKAMYSMAFTIKMASKFTGRDYKVCHLEGLWWGKRKGDNFMKLPRDQWNWELMIRVPEFVAQRHLADALAALKTKGKGEQADQVRLAQLDEGRCVQVLHVGPYADEPETIAAMKAFADEHGLKYHGLHHEIYLSDPRRVPPQRLRTILRQPVR